MARRRRLEPPGGAELDSIRAAAAAAVGPAAFSILPTAPIAQVAADAGTAALRDIEAGRTAMAKLSAAEEQGLMLADLALDEIDVDYLSRDRLPRAIESEDWQALKTSLHTHGQRTPIEVAPLDTATGRPYGLISGYRRIAALKRLYEETGDPRFSRAKAVVRRAGSLGQAFVAMVEENEIREGISFFERARVCLRGVEHGAFADVDAALNTLFGAASPAKRSKIRSFILVVDELGDMLAFPQAIGERLGLRLAGALKSGRGGSLRRALASQGVAATAEAEMEALRKALSGGQAPRITAGMHALPGGGLLTVSLRKDGARIEIAGRPTERAEIDAVVAAVVAAIGGEGR
jgi:ParB family chromosome partitioning protein